MTDYSEQLNQERNQDRVEKMGKKISEIKANIPAAVAQKMMKAIEDKQAWVWPFAFMLAAFNDLTDVGIIGSIPFLGDSLDVACGTVLTILFWNIGGMIKWKIRGAIWIASGLEIILGIVILPEFLPFWLLAVWYAHHRVGQKAESAESSLERSKKGRIDEEAVAEFE